MKKGWEIKKLGDVCKVIAGQSPESKFYNDNQEGLAFYQGKKEFTDKYLGKPTKWTTKVTKEAIKGDILMSVRAPVGPVNISTQKICIGRGLAAIRALEKMNRDYLFNFLIKHESEILGNSGAVFNSINKKQISEIPIPVPPLEEQKKIVEVLDKAFEGIDKAKSNVEKNLQNAKELFQSELNRIFSQKGDGWVEKKLGDAAKIMYGYTAKAGLDKKGPKYLRITDIQNQIVKWDTVPNCEISDDDFDKYELKEGEIVFARTGATTGKSYIVKRSPDAVFASYLIRVQLLDNTILPEFVYNFFQSPIYWVVINTGMSGSTLGGFNAKKLSGLKIPHPSLEKQKEIVKKLDSLSSDIKQLEAQYSKKLEDLQELKKSIMQKAFEGELV